MKQIISFLVVLCTYFAPCSAQIGDPSLSSTIIGKWYHMDLSDVIYDTPKQELSVYTFNENGVGSLYVPMVYDELFQAFTKIIDEPFTWEIKDKNQIIIKYVNEDYSSTPKVINVSRVTPNQITYKDYNSFLDKKTDYYFIRKEE